MYHHIILVPFPFGNSLTVHMNGSVMSIWVRASSGISAGSLGAHALVGIVIGSSRHCSPVSSATSRSAASFRDSPIFRRPLGSIHSFVLTWLTRQTFAFCGLEDMKSTAPQLSTNCSDAYWRVTKFESAICDGVTLTHGPELDVPSSRVHVKHIYLCLSPHMASSSL